MHKFGMGDIFSPGSRVISTEDSKVGFDFLINSFCFAIGLRVIGGGEGEVVV